MKFVILTGENIKTLIVFFLSLALGFVVSRLPLPGLGEAGRITLGIFTTAALLWVLEPFPLYVTSFVIVILEVIFLAREGGPLGLSGNQYTIFLNPFFDSVVVLFLGGFVMARAVKRYGLDERISRGIMRRVGVKPSIVLLGMMVTTAFLSLWISNTATTALMVAVAIPIIKRFPDGEPFRHALILGIPFASNIGGIGTPIGTPPNAIAMGILNQMHRDINFIDWMIRGIPVVVILTALCWIMLCRIFPPRIHRIEMELDEEEPMDRKSKFILVVFSLVVLLWLTSPYHGIPAAVVALIPLVVFFGLRLLGGDDLNDLGWGILFIIGGGMSLGIAMRESGLSQWIVGLIPFAGMNKIAILFIFAVAAAVMTTFISNSATANLLLPIVVGVTAVSAETSAVVVALAASAAMILPISTPPNAIAYGSGLIDVRTMMKGGSVITLISIVVIVLFIYLLF
ncbi:MAG: DASS family sodium-coupled anion symporter [Candidatus Krumholzibacteriota bacterium]|nr:DASS family sodium-coupled anion symporter [Candidatus Krumholzibacteriota bacterium]